MTPVTSAQLAKAKEAGEGLFKIKDRELIMVRLSMLHNYSISLLLMCMYVCVWYR